MHHAIGQTVFRVRQPVRLILALVLAVAATVADLPAEERQTEINFGIVPQQSSTTLARLWGPVTIYLEVKTRAKILFRTAPDIPTFEARLAAGKYDIAYMNPYHYTVFHDSPGYRAIAKEADKQLVGIVVVQRDDSIAGIRQLDGKAMAFPSPAAFAASLMPRAHFRNIGIHITARYVRSHDSVYRAVAKGLVSAGGGIERTFAAAPAGVRDQLRILWRTAPHSPHAIAVHPRISDELAQRIQAALVAMAQNPYGKRTLAALKITGFVAGADADWDDIRRLGIDPAANPVGNRPMPARAKPATAQ